MPIRHMLLATLTAAIWGSNFVAAKFGLQHFPPFFLTALRFAIIAVALLPFVQRPNTAQLQKIAALSLVLGLLHFSLLFASLYQGLDIASTAIVAQMGVPFSCLLGALLFRDRLTSVHLFGMVVAFSGIVVVAGSPHIWEHPAGFFIALGAAFAWGVANAIMKQLQALKTLQWLAWFALFAVPQLLLASWIFEGSPVTILEKTHFAIPLPALASVLYTTLLSTIVAYSIWSFLIQRYPLTQVAPFSLLVPVFGISFGQCFFQESIAAPTIIGGLIAIIGVAIIVLHRPKTLVLAEST